MVHIGMMAEVEVVPRRKMARRGRWEGRAAGRGEAVGNEKEEEEEGAVEC